MRPVPAKHPPDEHNEALLRNVHPSGWNNPAPAPCYNLVVIGGGTAGLVTAAGAAGLGAKVALLERELLGGDCLNTGCVPSKALIRAGRAAFDALTVEELGVSCNGVNVDFGKAMSRMRRVRAEISRHDSVQRFSAELGVDVFLGDARFVSGHEIEVQGKRLRFKKAAICTGSRSSVPAVTGLAEAGYLTSETVFQLTEQPGRIGIIGGGPIGCRAGSGVCPARQPRGRLRIRRPASSERRQRGRSSGSTSARAGPGRGSGALINTSRPERYRREGYNIRCRRGTRRVVG